METGFGTIQNNPIYISKTVFIQYILKSAYIASSCYETPLDCWLQY